MESVTSALERKHTPLTFQGKGGDVVLKSRSVALDFLPLQIIVDWPDLWLPKPQPKSQFTTTWFRLQFIVRIISVASQIGTLPTSGSNSGSRLLDATCCAWSANSATCFCPQANVLEVGLDEAGTGC